MSQFAIRENLIMEYEIPETLIFIWDARRPEISVPGREMHMEGLVSRRSEDAEATVDSPQELVKFSSLDLE